MIDDYRVLKNRMDMKNFIHNIGTSAVVLLMLIAIAGCEDKENKKVEDKLSVKTEADNVIDVVTTIKVRLSDFHTQIVSNGKIEATNIADLMFGSNGGIIERVYVKNGQYVKKGQAIASLDKSDLINTIEKKKMDCEMSEFQLKDILIGQGYSYDNQSEIPQKILRLAMIKSGYLRDKKELDEYQQQMEKTTLRAPFSGLIANLTAKSHSATGTDPVCQLISQNSMEVQFPLVENEVRLIKVGDPVSIKTYDDGDSPMTGRIKSINPMVNKDGLIMISATVNPSHKLISGMSVRVFINKTVSDQIVVPKTAVVRRSDRDVVFTVEKNKAVWHYVNIGIENLKEYTIADGIKPGMEVIVSGSQNLSDGSVVKVQK